jgi:hypothetical protein
VIVSGALVAILISMVLVAATIAIHYEVLRQTSLRLVNLGIPPRMRIIAMLIAAFLSHLVHITLYAAAFVLMESGLAAGSIGGPHDHHFRDAFYFSITSYTTLGIGDLFPTGALRVVSGIEALNGLVMVGWTASVTYLYMERFWNLRLKR